MTLKTVNLKHYWTRVTNKRPVEGVVLDKLCLQLHLAKPFNLDIKEHGD